VVVHGVVVEQAEQRPRLTVDVDDPQEHVGGLVVDALAQPARDLGVGHPAQDLATHRPGELAGLDDARRTR
jgi:hypothetical protein